MKKSTISDPEKTTGFHSTKTNVYSLGLIVRKSFYNTLCNNYWKLTLFIYCTLRIQFISFIILSPGHEIIFTDESEVSS